MYTPRAIWLVPLVLIGTARAAEPDPELVYAENTLKNARIETSGTALLQFLRERTLTDQDRARLADAVSRLGNDDFETRERAGAALIRAGRKALPYLRSAEHDKDPERARWASRCIEEIENEKNLSLVAAVVRVLEERRPEGTAAALLDYLPANDDEAVESAVLRALAAVAVKDGVPAPVLLAALNDKEPLRRVAAAHVLGRSAPRQRPAVRRLLADTEARVRFEAADALARTGDKDAVPVLIALLGDGPLALGWRAQEILYRIAGDKAPPVTLSDEDPARRAQVADAWRGWWQEAGPTTDLAKINFEEALQGVNLICEEGKGDPRVWACRADGKPLWEIKGVLAWDAQLLTNGHVLIAEHSAQQVTERDPSGKIVWSKKVTTGNLTTCQRLPNGNTFIGTFNELLEVDPTGKTVYSYKNPSGGLIARAHRLRNGHLLFACDGSKIVELDAKFKPIRTINIPANGDSWISVEPLPGERFLVAAYGSHKVTEIDAAGKLLWQCDTQTPMSAVRLANGNTLVSCDRGNAVIEYDRAGKEVWKLKLASSVCAVRRF